MFYLLTWCCSGSEDKINKAVAMGAKAWPCRLLDHRHSPSYSSLVVSGRVQLQIWWVILALWVNVQLFQLFFRYMAERAGKATERKQCYVGRCDRLGWR